MEETLTSPFLLDRLLVYVLQEECASRDDERVTASPIA